MFLQIFIGSLLILVSVIVAAIGFFLLEFILQRAHGWLIREPHVPKLTVVLLGAVVAVLWMITAGVWIWAIAFRLLGLFEHFEAS